MRQECKIARRESAIEENAKLEQKSTLISTRSLRVQYRLRKKEVKSRVSAVEKNNNLQLVNIKDNKSQESTLHS